MTSDQWVQIACMAALAIGLAAAWLGQKIASKKGKPD